MYDMWVLIMRLYEIISAVGTVLEKNLDHRQLKSPLMFKILPTNEFLLHFGDTYSSQTGGRTDLPHHPPQLPFAVQSTDRVLCT